jgi:glycosyltransferase involved in cell wall biosynthesis
MKVLLVNKFFFPFGGTETAMFQEAELLRRLGHEVVFFSMAHPQNRPCRQAPFFAAHIDFERTRGALSRLRAAGRILFGREPRKRLARLLASEKPDIAHLHNVYHHLSPAIIATLKQHGVPVVLTLHDYKTVCPAYKLFSGGRPCERCRGGRWRWCVLRRCVKGSVSGSLIGWLEARLQRANYRRVDRFICPSRFLLDKVREMGLDGEFALIANFTNPAAAAVPAPPPSPLVLFFGRLVEEKGAALLIEAMQGVAADCLIVGDGPEKAALQAQAARLGTARVAFAGHQPRAELERLLGRASMVVVPSVWHENNPFSILEAFAQGVPVVAARIGGIPELVREGETGLLFRPGDAADLRRRIDWLLAHPREGRTMATNARRRLARDFSPERHGEDLLRLFRELLAPHGQA